ncbi:palindromic element RPE2 domain-containing protein [Rickettsia endosymbiont of Oedothorax gibbosus]|uniref:palindromic element RPE2 domain-containing protein n=1 Tax=Rickettsia endosymbiont of Oedothorax gibbosus TaxID=931099 RepID=UPI0020247489|nr:palindromic element RPE2 domain-containing protein [Rickettsia endosymbiont of Oedothorax gibbosus]
MCSIAPIVNSGEVDARSDGATPISNRRATSDNVTNFSSIDYTSIMLLVSSVLSLIVLLVFFIVY